MYIGWESPLKRYFYFECKVIDISAKLAIIIDEFGEEETWYYTSAEIDIIEEPEPY